MQNSHLFISYSPDQTRLALTLSQGLLKAGIPVWLDRLQGWASAEPWEYLVPRALNQSEAFLAILSPKYCVTPYCWEEFNIAKAQNRPIYGVVTQEIEDDTFAKGIQFDFTNWEDQQTYSKQLDSLIRSLKTNTFTDSELGDNALINYFVNLQIAAQRERTAYSFLLLRDNNSNTRPDPRKQEIIFPDIKVSLEAVEDGESADETISLRVSDIWSHFHHLILKGPGGVGKTFLLLQMAAVESLAFFDNPVKHPLPFYLDLSQWQRQGSSFDQFFSSICNFYTDLIPEQPRHYYFDHFDTLDSSQMADFLQWILANKVLDSQIIMTCRDVEWQEEHHINFPVAEISIEGVPAVFASFYFDQQAETFLHLVLPQNHRQNDGYQYFMHRLTQKFHLLSLLGEIFSVMKSDDLPSNIGALMEYLIFMLVTNKSPNNFQKEDESKLSRLAQRLIEQDIDALPVSEVESELGNVLNEYISARLLDLRQGNISFYYSFLKDYFAANALLTGILEEKLDEHVEHLYFDSLSGKSTGKWESALIALSGQVEDKNSFVALIASYDPWLAVSCIDSGVVVDTELENALLLTLTEIIEEETHPGVLVSTFEAFTTLSDPSVIPLLVKLLQASDTDNFVSYEAGFFDALGLDMEELTQDIPEVRETLRQSNMLDDFWRFRAVETLESFGDEAIPAMLSLLDHTTESVFYSVAIALGRMQTDVVVPYLLQMLATKGGEYSVIIPITLSQMGQVALPGLIEAMQHSNPDIRVGATLALNSILKQHPSEQVIPYIIAGLRDEEEHVRGFSGAALLQFGDVIVPYLLKELDSTDIETFSAVLELLIYIGQPAINALISYMTTADGQKKALIAESLSTIGPALIPELERIFLTSQNREELIGVAWTLGFLGEHGRQVLFNALNSNTLELRLAALSGLGLPGNSVVIPQIAPILQDDDPLVRGLAVRALGSIGSKVALPYVHPLLSDSDDRVSLAAIMALGKLQEPDVIPDLIQTLLNHRYDEKFRQLGIQTLASFGQDGIPIILEVLETSSDDFVYSLLSSALIIMGDSAKLWLQTIPPLSNQSAHCYVMFSLGELEGDPVSRLLTVVLENMSEQTQKFLISVVCNYAEGGDIRAINILLQAADSNYWDVRMLAMDCLSTIPKYILLDHSRNMTHILPQLILAIGTDNSSKNDDELVDFARLATHSDSKIRLATIIAASLSEYNASNLFEAHLMDPDFLVSLAASEYISNLQ